MERDWLPYLDVAVENANDAVMVCDWNAGTKTFTMRYVNPMFERQTGYQREEAIGQPPSILYGPLTSADEVERATLSLESGLPIRIELLKYRKDGTHFWTEMNMRPISDGPELMGFVGIQRDIDERVKAMAQLTLLSLAMDQANDAVAIFEWRERSAEWRLSYVNEMFLRMTGYRHDEVIGRTSDFLVGPETNHIILQNFRMSLLAGDSIRGEIAFHRADGTPFWTELNGTPIRNPAGEVINTVIVYRDVTEQHFRDQRLTFEAAHDPLTGAYNRRYFMQALDNAIADARPSQHTHGLLFFDLDGFKPINDLHGHEAGDRMLIGLSTNIDGKLRRGDVLARLGGDEFAVLLTGCTREMTEKIASNVLASIRDFQLLWAGHVLRVGVSMGVLTIDETIESSAEALRRADEACYEAKRSGRNRLVSA
ncbi:MAG: diguanylate cyclase [Candidatus Eremiobacteraeota bacterium]|nr:diguanylate cyclase [Candidatus Eremiobacteraeota bacterium]